MWGTALCWENHTSMNFNRCTGKVGMSGAYSEGLSMGRESYITPSMTNKVPISEARFP